MPTLAIYGAGPALGAAVARRFGRGGFRVALVARNRERLEEMARDLALEGIEAHGFPADIADRTAAMRAADEIEARFGAIDVLEHSPTPGRFPGSLFAGPLELDIDRVAALLDLYVLAPIALVERLLPGMRERDRGALLFAMGAAAKYPIPRVAAGGIALSGLRSYVHTLNSALNETGVYAGALLIGATIEHSGTHRAAIAPAIGDRPQAVIPAEVLADRLWDLYTKKDRAEDVIAPAISASYSDDQAAS